MLHLPSAADLWRRFGGGGPPGEADDDANRRVWARRASSFQTRVHPTRHGSAAVPARVRDISRGGASLEVGRAFDPGELVSVELLGPNAASTALACVVHVNELADGSWLLGCTFAQELGDDDLAAFGARRRRAGGPDQRVWERFACTAAASCRLLSADGEPAWPAKVSNISATGVGLIADRDLETGTLVNVTMQGAGGAPATLLACVVHVSPRAGGRWGLGCNFIRELTEAELLAMQ